ncbi:Diacylglycerol kinase delta [Armadillidium vulgare]|nr:Diacylglycerol kinase delta [Armadillidium vulgare]
MGVLPLGTGNDLARVLGWGSSCDDDAHLPQIIEKYERATTKMLDRWSIMTFVSHMPVEPHHKMDPDVPDTFLNQVSRYENSVANHVVTLLQSDQHSEVIASAKVICETVKSLIVKVGGLNGEAILNREGKDSLTCKCEILNDKLDLLLRALHQESMARPSITSLSIGIPCIPPIAQEEDSIIEEIIEMTEKALDEQNAQSHLASGHLPQITLQCPDDPTSHELKDSPSTEGPSPAYLSPYLSTLTTNFPLAPASPILHPRGSIGQTSVLGVPPPPSSLQIPTQISPPRSPIPGSDIHYLSPLPNVRRESECEAFDFPPTLPVPSMFADLEREKEARRDSFLQIESQSRRESSSLNPEDVEIRIQSSTDDLLTVGDDEPFAFEEKSISEIRDSMASAATSLDTSFDAEDLEDEEVEEEKDKEEKLLVKRGEREPPDGGVKEEESVGGGNSGDSEDTDDTVKEKAEDSENGAQLSPLPEQEVMGTTKRAS